MRDDSLGEDPWFVYEYTDAATRERVARTGMGDDHHADDDPDQVIRLSDLVPSKDGIDDPASTDADMLGEFDPHVERIDDAIRRLMPNVEALLRAELERRIEKVVGADAVHNRPIPVDSHFEWLVRYQVMGESMESLARAANTDRKVVSRAVKQTAEIVGLTLRKPATGGRPRNAERPAWNPRLRPRSVPLPD